MEYVWLIVGEENVQSLPKALRKSVRIIHEDKAFPKGSEETDDRLDVLMVVLAPSVKNREKLVGKFADWRHTYHEMAGWMGFELSPMLVIVEVSPGGDERNDPDGGELEEIARILHEDVHILSWEDLEDEDLLQYHLMTANGRRELAQCGPIIDVEPQFIFPAQPDVRLGGDEDAPVTEIIEGPESDPDTPFTYSEVLQVLAEDEYDCLFTGPDGVGKLALARWVHYLSDLEAWQEIDCSKSISKKQLESALNKALGGHLLLKNISPNPPTIVNWLSGRMKDSDVAKQVIFLATETTPEHTVSALPDGTRERFLEIPIEPLNRRQWDIVTLARAFVTQYSALQGKRFELTMDTSAHLVAYPWPGNVRELRDVLIDTLKSLPANSDRGKITVDSLPKKLLNTSRRIHGIPADERSDIQDSVIRHYIRRYRANLAAAAQELKWVFGPSFHAAEFENTMRQRPDLLRWFAKNYPMAPLWRRIDMPGG